jgi:hypothetical protein
MINRSIENKIRLLSEKFPVVIVTGPRQSGKTTLIKSMFPGYRYESLEDPDTRLFAQSDPRRFLGFREKIVIDEVQRVPDLFSYIQTLSDSQDIPGQFILSGSQSFLLNHHISQSLAGRAAIFHLLPFSLDELWQAKMVPDSPDKILWKGFFPRLYDKDIDPVDFYPNYIQTYVERDLRLMQNIHDLSLFIRFIKLCAGRIGQLLNMNSIAVECGISPNTARAWLSVLEASYLVYLLVPHHASFNKRLVKMPKLYFTDSGLACSLLEIRNESQLGSHYMRGSLFEGFVISELLKGRYNRGLRSNLFFWRDNKGSEIDCLIDNPPQITPVEIKSGSTFSTDFFRQINYWNKLSGNRPENSWVIYGGDTSRITTFGNLLKWDEVRRVPIV